MKYTIEGFSQAELVRLGLDATDAVLLRWFADFFLGSMQKVSLMIRSKCWEVAHGRTQQ